MEFNDFLKNSSFFFTNDLYLILFDRTGLPFRKADRTGIAFWQTDRLRKVTTVKKAKHNHDNIKDG